MLKECIDPAATEVGVRRRKKGCRMGRGAGGMRDDSASTRGGWGSDDDETQRTQTAAVTAADEQFAVRTHTTKRQVIFGSVLDVPVVWGQVFCNFWTL